MLDRYSTKEIQKIWSEENRYTKYVQIESLVNSRLQMYHIIPNNKLCESLDRLDIEKLIKRSKELEEETRHDINAFVFTCEELCEDGRWIHYGLTSSDIVDTCNAALTKESLTIIDSELRSLHDCLNKYHKYYHKEIMGRTHGKLAEHTRLINIFKLFQQELSNHIDSIPSCNLPGKISGVVGDNKYVPQCIEQHVLSYLGLKYQKTNQIVQRENYARLVFNLSLIACTLEKMCLQIRLYQQSGIEEMSEPFEDNQTGSSALAHKKNPILCENVCGLSRLLRGYVIAAMENVSLWNERDISHSSNERIILPDIFNVLHFMLKRTNYIFKNLQINFDNINKHMVDLDSQGEMLHLISEGYGRKEAYKIIQEKYLKGSI